MSLADLGGEDLSKSFLSLAERGRSRISLRALTIVAERLSLPISHFLDDPSETSARMGSLTLDRAEEALARQKPEECLGELDGATLAPPLRPRGLLLRGRALVDLDRPREAIPVLQEGLALVEQSEDRHLARLMAYHLGAALYSAGKYEEALVYLQRALQESIDGLDDQMLAGKITIYIGHILYIQDDIEGALTHYARARDLFGSFGDLTTLGCIYSGLSKVYERKGDLTNAVRYSTLSLGAFEAKQNAVQAARELNNLAVKYEALGNTTQALECGKQAVERAQRANATDIEALAHSTLASIYLKLDDVEHAAEEASIAEGLAQEESDYARIDAWVVLAEIAERNGDRARADELYLRALDALKSTSRRAAYAETALAYSRLLQQRGDTERALEYALEVAHSKIASTS